MLRNLGTIVALALGSALAQESPAPAASPSRSEPVLLVQRTAIDAVAGGGSRDAYAARLALASLTPEDRERVRTAFDDASTRLEADVFDIDLGDGDPLEELHGALTPWSATFDAARGIARGHWRSRDLTVRVAASCAEARAEETCVRVSADERSDLARRARFVAWPISTMVRRELPTIAARERCAAILRERARVPGSPLALVVTTEAVTPLDTETEDAGRRLARAIAVSQREDGEAAPLRAMLQDTDRDPSLSWLALGATEIAVVPRLSSMFDRAAVAREVDDAVRAALESERR